MSRGRWSKYKTPGIVTIKRNSFHCNCGCGRTYSRKEFVDHYKEDVLPVSLTKFAESSDAGGLLQNVTAPQNFRIF
jgi:hypothetical protein